MSDPQDAKRIEQLQDRLDHVEEEIEEARQDAEKVFPHERESFAQHGVIRTKDPGSHVADSDKSEDPQSD